MLTAFWGPSVSTKKHLSSYFETVVEQTNVMPAESLLGGEDAACSPSQMDNMLLDLHNRSLALRGQVTNASFKPELESCWCQKLREGIKIILHPKFERKRF